MMNKVVEFAKTNGYDKAVYSGKWHDYDVYDPCYDDNEVRFEGLPFFILVKDDTIRMSTDDEAFSYIDTFPDD